MIRQNKILQCSPHRIFLFIVINIQQYISELTDICFNWKLTKFEKKSINTDRPAGLQKSNFLAGSDQFLVCKTDSICIKRIFFWSEKTTLRIIYWPNYLDLSSVKPLIVYNYSSYQCCQHIRVTESWKMRSRLVSLPLARIKRRNTFAEFLVLELNKYSWRHDTIVQTWLASVSQFLNRKHRRFCWIFHGFQPRFRDLVQIFLENH